jgi:hypothetical protein
MFLKDGSEVTDNRVDRLVQFDERSRSFSIASAEQKELRSYTWRCNEWFDQGKEGACVAYALGHEMASRPAEQKGIYDKWLIENVYWEAQRNDPWEGGAYPNANPRYEGTSVLSGVKALHKQKFFGEYRWAFSFRDLLEGIGYNGPAVLGVNWYQNMFNTDSEGFIKPTGYIGGGHAVLARAVNVKTGVVTIRNSWGKSWGRNGDCYIKFDDLEKLMSERGEAVFVKNRTAMFHESTLPKI